MFDLIAGMNMEVKYHEPTIIIGGLETLTEKTKELVMTVTFTKINWGSWRTTYDFLLTLSPC